MSEVARRFRSQPASQPVRERVTSNDMVIRPEAPADAWAVRRVNVDAFEGPDEAAIVERLHMEGLVLVSLVAVAGGIVVGHILFSRLPVLVSGRSVDAVALAPMAVQPASQRRGIGSALVRAGVKRCRELDERLVVVVGHPAFYPRFGFSAGLATRLRAPFSGESFMALELVPGAIEAFDGGHVRYPAAFGLTR